MTATFPTLAREIHASNVVAGWYTDLDTMESTVFTRNRPEMLMLAVIALAEALDGADGRPDDKLLHLPMYSVELADFVIRILDQIGCEVACGHAMPAFWVGSVVSRRATVPSELMYLVQTVSHAMEHYRKRRMPEYLQNLADSIVQVFDLANQQDIDLHRIMAEKRRFNASRADHKIENRLADGGKKI